MGGQIALYYSLRHPELVQTLTLLASVPAAEIDLDDTMITPYLNFSGDCEEALKLYQKAFDGKIVHISRYGNIPDNPDSSMDEKQKSQIMHAQMMLTESGGISAADVALPYEKGTAVNIHVHCVSEEFAQKAFSILAEEDTVIGEIATNPPPDDIGISGAVKDKYGFIWILSAMKN